MSAQSLSGLLNLVNAEIRHLGSLVANTVEGDRHIHNGLDALENVRDEIQYMIMDGYG